MRKYDNFHETLATPADTDWNADYSPVATVVSAIAGLLGLLLGVRFIAHLFSSDNAVGLVAIVHGLTNWMTAPFDALLLSTPTMGSGYVDWSALLALVVLALVTGLVMRLTQPRA